jgi:CRISPR-associated protein Cas1
MLQLPDFKEKQIVFIGLNDAEKISTLRVKNENLVVYDQFGELMNQVSCSKLFAVFLMGEFSITSNLIKKLLSYGVSIIMTNKYNFKVYAEIGAVAEGNYWLRYKQYYFDKDLEFARQLVLNKITNQLTLIKEVNPGFFANKSKLNFIKEFKTKTQQAGAIDELMGIEGSFSKVYFNEIYGKHDWYKRMPRTKIDVNNLLLDVGYTLLFNFVDCLLKLHGFDTYKGIFHQLFFQRKSLTCDLVEPFRCLIDKALVRAYGLKQIKKSDFKKTKNGYYLKFDVQKKYMRIFSEELMANKEEIFKYVKGFYFAMLNENTDFPQFIYK